MKTIRISEAQMTALETAGLFECPDESEIALASAICGSKLSLNGNSDQIARIINDLSNAADELSRDLTGELAAWARKDARVLANLYSKALGA